MATAAFAAVGRTRREARITLATNLLVAVVLGGKDLERRLDNAATETRQHFQYEGGMGAKASRGWTNRRTRWRVDSF